MDQPNFYWQGGIINVATVFIKSDLIGKIP